MRSSQRVHRWRAADRLSRAAAGQCRDGAVRGLRPARGRGDRRYRHRGLGARQSCDAHRRGADAGAGSGRQSDRAWAKAGTWSPTRCGRDLLQDSLGSDDHKLRRRGRHGLPGVRAPVRAPDEVGRVAMGFALDNSARAGTEELVGVRGAVHRAAARQGAHPVVHDCTALPARPRRSPAQRRAARRPRSTCRAPSISLRPPGSTAPRPASTSRC